MNGAAPDGYRTITPRMVVDDVAGAVDSLRACFGAVGEVAAGRPSELRIGDSLIMVSGTEERAAFPAMLYVYVDDAEATYERGVAAGAESLEAPLDVPWGDRRAILRDRWGNVYQVAHHRR